MMPVARDILNSCNKGIDKTNILLDILLGLGQVYVFILLSSLQTSQRTSKLRILAWVFELVFKNRFTIIDAIIVYIVPIIDASVP